VPLLALLQFVKLKYDPLFFILFDKQIASRHSYWTARTEETILKERI
jgi:hypothetical protein